MNMYIMGQVIRCTAEYYINYTGLNKAKRKKIMSSLIAGLRPTILNL